MALRTNRHNIRVPGRWNTVGYYIIMFRLSYKLTLYMKVKVKLTLELATKAQRGSRGIAVLFL